MKFEWDTADEVKRESQISNLDANIVYNAATAVVTLYEINRIYMMKASLQG